MRHGRTISLFVLSLFCWSCAPEKPQKRGAQERVASGRQTEAVLEVGAEEFSVAEVQKRLETLRTTLPGADASDTQLGAIAQFELLADEAERRGYGKDPRVVNAVKDSLAEAATKEKRTPAEAKAPPTVDEAALKEAFEAGRKKRK